MQRPVEYHTAHHIENLLPAGDLIRYEKEVIKLMRFSKSSFIDNKTFAEQVIYVKNNYKDWHEVKGFYLRYKVIKAIKKSFKGFNKMMSYKDTRTTTIPYGKEYFLSSQSIKTYLQTKSTTTVSFDLLDSNLDSMFEQEYLTAVDYLELKRLLEQSKY